MVPMSELQPLGAVEFTEHHRAIRTHLFRWTPNGPVQPAADGREIVWAGFLPRSALTGANLGLLPRLALAREAQLPSGTLQTS